MSGDLAIIERIDETFRQVGIDAIRGALVGDHSAAETAAPMLETSSEVVHPDDRRLRSEEAGDWLISEVAELRSA